MFSVTFQNWRGYMSLITDMVQSGLSLIACGADKRPLASWKEFIDRRPSQEEAERINPPIGVVCGKVSGGLVALDFDDKGSRFNAWVDLVMAVNPKIMMTLLIQKTPSGGYHVVYRCPETDIRNVKLACLKQPDAAGKNVLIETRGEGGYFIAAPSPGYELYQADFLTIPIISLSDHELFISCAKSFHEKVEEKKPPVANTTDYSLSPFDEYNLKNSPVALLESHGWTTEYQKGETVYLKRPGKKDKGISATWNHQPGIFYVFSSNTEFENEKGYKAAAVYALLEHGGNFKNAAKALIEMGYGKRNSVMKMKEVSDISDSDLKTAETLERDWLVLINRMSVTSFGITALNKVASTFSPGEVFAIAARTGVGKTTLGLALFKSITTAETKKGLIFSLEMSGEMLYQRAAFMYFGETGSQDCFFNPDFTKNSIDKMKDKKIRSQINNSLTNAIVVDKTKVTIPVMAECLSRARSKYGQIDLVVIDYLGYLNDIQSGNSYEKVSRIVKDCKELAKEMRTRIILLCQTSREGGDGNLPVELNHLRDSGAVEESVDYLLGMWGSKSDSNRIHCKMLKNRWHQKGTLFDLINTNLCITEADSVLEETEPEIKKGGKKWNT